MKDKFLDAKGLGHFWKRIVEYIKGTTPTKVSQLENDSHYMANGVTSFNGSTGAVSFSETDPTVPTWAKQSTKPSYTAEEVGALPDSTVIPEGIPTGGTTGQVLRKTSNADYAVEWHDEEGGGGGGVQSDWNQSDSTKLDYIKNKPTIPAEVTESTVSGWGFTKNTGTYSKPSTGIPSTDLDSDVQTSLGKADTALQSFTETDPTVPSWAKQSSKPTYTAQEVGALPSSTVIPAAPGTLNTDNSTAQSVSSSEALSGTIKLHKVSKTGSYNDLLNKPTIPAAQVQSDWNATTGMGVILNKPTIPTVPTNVSAFTNDAGYLTAHQDISGKEDKMGIITVSATSLAPSVNKYYRFTADVGTLAVTLPTVTDTTKVASIVFYLTTGLSPAVTFTSTHSVVYQDGFQLDASKTYEVNALFNGSAWVLMAAEINTGS